MEKLVENVQDKDKFGLAREQFIEGVEEIVTDKNWSLAWGDPGEIVGKLQRGEKIPWHDWLRGRAIMIGQQMRLTPDEIDEFLDTVFEQGWQKEMRGYDNWRSKKL